MGSEYLLNADFDLSLRSGWRPPEGETARRRITDLAWHGLFLADDGDSVLLPAPVPSDFAEYLDRNGISPPTTTVEPDRGRGQRLAPFGWNEPAHDLAVGYDAETDHPDIGVVRRVNGRRFSARLEDDLFGGDHTLAEFDSETELLDVFSKLPDSESGWVLKAGHGNAGLGNRRLRSRRLSEGDRKVVRRFFHEDDVAVLERWRPRLRDLCSTFTITQGGRAVEIKLHEVVNTAEGALIGALFEEDPAPLAEWRSPMADASLAVADRLAGAGYFGPVCMDAFVWRESGRPRLRPLVDLNARRAMSAGAFRLWRRLGGRGAAYWRFFTRRKLGLPESYPAVVITLAEDAYDPRSGTGVLITAPLWLGAERRAPAKTAVLILGSDRAEVFAIDRRLRGRLEK